MGGFIANFLGNQSLKNETILGVDITPHYIRISQINFSAKGKPVLRNLASTCIEGLYRTQDIMMNTQVYVDQLKELIEKNNIKPKFAAISLPATGAIIRSANIPAMSEEDLAQASQFGSMWQNTLNIMEDLSNYNTFYHVLARHEDTQTMDILFAATPSSESSIYLDIVKQAGLTPVITNLRNFALLSAFYVTSPNTEKECVFIEFGPDENYIFIKGHAGFTQHEVFVTDEDRNLLITPADNDLAVQEFVQRFADQLKQILMSPDTALQGRKPSNIFVSSSLPLHVNNPSAQPMINVFVKTLFAHMEESGIPVSECTFCDHMDVPERFASTVNAEGKLSSWAVTMGMAMQRMDAFDRYKGLDKVRNINLLPDVATYKNVEKVKITATAAIAATVALWIAIFGTSSFYLWAEKQALAFQLAQSTEVEAAHLEKKSEVEQLQTINQKLNSLDGVRKELPSNQEVLILMHKHVMSVIPEGVWLNEVIFTAPNSVEVKGNAVDDQSILEFITDLNVEGPFEKISLKTMQASREKSKYSERSILLKEFTLYGAIKEDAAPPKEEKPEEHANVLPLNQGGN